MCKDVVHLLAQRCVINAPYVTMPLGNTKQVVIFFKKPVSKTGPIYTTLALPIGFYLTFRIAMATFSQYPFLFITKYVKRNKSTLEIR
jgi:hypothetical protein